MLMKKLKTMAVITAGRATSTAWSRIVGFAPLRLNIVSLQDAARTDAAMYSNN